VNKNQRNCRPTDHLPEAEVPRDGRDVRLSITVNGRNTAKAVRHVRKQLRLSGSVLSPLLGLVTFPLRTHGLRRGLRSPAASRLKSVAAFCVQGGLLTSYLPPKIKKRPGDTGPTARPGVASFHSADHVSRYPPAFSSVKTCLAISLRVSKTPTPWKATASSTGSFFLRSSLLRASAERMLGRSRLLSCRT